MITNKDFVSMKTDVGEFVGDTTSSFLLKVGKYLNFRYRDILRRYPWKQIFGSTTITTVANQATYAMPWDFEEPVYIFDNTNKVSLWEKPEIGALNDTALVGSSQYFSVKESSCAAQPTSASALSIVSSSASDTGTVFIKGTLSTGVEVVETVTLTGTTPVASANSYTGVVQASKNAISVGTITITSNSSAVSIAVLGPRQMQARYRILHLYYIPSATTSIVVRYKKRVLPLVNDYDYPIIDFADEMIFGAQADAWRAKRQFQKAAALEAQYEELVEKRMYQQEQTHDVSFDPTPYPRDVNYNASTSISSS